MTAQRSKMFDQSDNDAVVILNEAATRVAVNPLCPWRYIEEPMAILVHAIYHLTQISTVTLGPRGANKMSDRFMDHHEAGGRNIDAGE
jgi:hypothetical protein